jgi:hypothetical protein
MAVARLQIADGSESDRLGVVEKPAWEDAKTMELSAIGNTCSDSASIFTQSGSLHRICSCNERDWPDTYIYIYIYIYI